MVECKIRYTDWTHRLLLALVNHSLVDAFFLLHVQWWWSTISQKKASFIGCKSHSHSTGWSKKDGIARGSGVWGFHHPVLMWISDENRWCFRWFHQKKENVDSQDDNFSNSSEIEDKNWLVVWLPFFIFPLILGCFHHPNWRSHIFQRGGATTNQMIIYNWRFTYDLWFDE